ncbi:MAG: NAD-dependent epimerase/dehydratase family protein [Bacteroidales bacterium]
MMQTILGAGGTIGIELSRSLSQYTAAIRIVSRNPTKVNPSDQLFQADLTNRDQTLKAVEGSEIVYLTAGLPYNVKTWQSAWPVIMENVLNACKTHKAKFIFFDNIYIYDGKNLNPMTEDHPVNPPSEKGKVRKKIANMVMNAHEKGEVECLIARCADYYGPSVRNTSMLTEMVLKPLSLGRKANWMGGLDYKHSFTFTPDAGKATALLGNTNDAFGQVWHLPTASNPFTGREWIENIAGELAVKPKYQLASKWMVRVLGLFIPVMKEMVEMYYQYDRDYVFDSSKFEKRFGINPTSYPEGIKEIVKTDYTR